DFAVLGEHPALDAPPGRQSRLLPPAPCGCAVILEERAPGTGRTALIGHDERPGRAAENRQREIQKSPFHVRTCCLLGSYQVELPEQLDRRTVEAFQRHVADVAEILAADRTRIETGGGEITVHGKKARRIAPFRCSARRVADVIADAGLLPGI